jgi:hypothetical protein
MTKTEFLSLMKFPSEWDQWGLYPDELFQGQLNLYKPGDERGSEHDRNGAFHWWLKEKPELGVLLKLLALTHLDSDQTMAADARKHIERAIQNTINS